MKNCHTQTIYAAAIRPVRRLPYARERLELRDGDFVDVDYVRKRCPRIAVICHGLESSSREAYVYGMGHALRKRGWDIAVLNMRGCSGEPNRLLRAYHSGETGDLHETIASIESKNQHAIIALVGLSLGGNIVLKYAGEQGPDISPKIVAAAAVSAPCDLAESARKLEMPGNVFYLSRFIRKLKRKALTREKRFPGAVDYKLIRSATTFTEFDELFTAPVNGFPSAEEYWTRASCRRVVSGIRIPALLINAMDDPFLTRACNLEKEAAGNSRLEVEVTSRGGHLAFVRRIAGEGYHESRVAGFLDRFA